MHTQSPSPTKRPPMPTFGAALLKNLRALLKHLRSLVTTVVIMIILGGIGFIVSQYKEQRQRNPNAQANYGREWAASFSQMPAGPPAVDVPQSDGSVDPAVAVPQSGGSVDPDELTAEERLVVFAWLSEDPEYLAAAATDEDYRQFLVEYTYDVARLAKRYERTQDPAVLRILQHIETIPQDSAAAEAYLEQLNDLDYVQFFLVDIYSGSQPVSEVRQLIVGTSLENVSQLRSLLRGR